MLRRPAAFPPTRARTLTHDPPSILYNLYAEVETVIQPGQCSPVPTEVMYFIPARLDFTFEPRPGLLDAYGLMFKGQGHGNSFQIEIHLENVFTDPVALPPGEHIANLVTKPAPPPVPFRLSTGETVVYSIEEDRLVRVHPGRPEPLPGTSIRQSLT